MVIAAAYNASKQARRDLTDDEVVQVLTREAKTRAESVEAYAAAGRSEAADREKAEIEIIRAYLFEQLDEAELARLVAEAVDETGASSAREMGKVMACSCPRSAAVPTANRSRRSWPSELARRDLAEHSH